jgi:hypothetical protein
MAPFRIADGHMRGVVREGFDLVAHHSVGLALGSLALEKETENSRTGLFYQPGVLHPQSQLQSARRRFDKIGLDSYERRRWHYRCLGSRFSEA